jgi:nitroreductase/NAD-dependent dihydropyrimidine dehydrogenase PreA subunit
MCIAEGGHMVDNRQFIEKTKRDVLFGREITPPHVEIDKCKGCGQCVKVCPALVFELKEKKSEVRYGEGCIACGHCWAVCPEEAIIQQEATPSTSLKPGPGSAVSADTLQLLIRERRSTRLFKDEPVSKEQLLKIIEAGRYAPTASNRQDVNYVILSNQQKVSELRSLVESFMEKTFRAMQNSAIALFYKMKFGSSAVDLLHHYAMGYQFLKTRKEKNAYFPLPFGSAVIITHAQSFDTMAPFNCSVAIYNCSLMAHSLGLGSCFMGFVQIGANMDKKIKHWLEIPKEHQSYGAMVLGHPDVRYRRLIERKKPDIKWR